MREKYRQKILAAAETGYREFSAKLLPGTENIMGVRLPVLRKMAAEMVRSGDWEEWLEEYWRQENACFEEDMLAGICIASAKVRPESRLLLIRDFLPHIRNWSVCDSFCASMKDVPKNREFYWKFATECLQSTEEFTVRVGAVLLLDHFCILDWAKRTVLALAAVSHPGYYAQMAQAWALAEFYFCSQEEVLPLLEGSRLSSPVRRMAVRKICESRKSSPEERTILRNLLKGEPA